jgi:hypothetical protein
MRSLFALLLLAATASCESNSNKPAEETSKQDSMPTTPANTDNTLTAAEQDEGWQSLFDGATKNAWHVFNNKSDGAAWKITDGTIHLDSTGKVKDSIPGGGDLVTNDEFENFHLKLEWKLGPAGNSGIMFFVQEGPQFEKTYHTGPEMQVLDNAGHKDAKIIKHHAGDLYDLISSSPETVKPAGEWNQVEIIANKGLLEFHLNGSKVLSTTMWDENWNKLVAGSKFKQWPGFGTYKKGRIALQDHGDPVWYRNIRIRKL